MYSYIFVLFNCNINKHFINMFNGAFTHTAQMRIITMKNNGKYVEDRIN